MLIKRITNIISILIIIISLLLTIFIKNEITRIIFSSIFTGFLASLIFNIPLLLSIKFKEIKQLYNSLYEIKSNCSFLRNDITDFIENNKTISKEDFESYRKIVLSNNEIIKNIDNYLYFNRHKKNCLHQFKWELIDRINFINALINNVYSKISNIN